MLSAGSEFTMPAHGQNIKISVSELSFSYFDKPVLNNICAEFQENSISAVVGPSGSGKSTLLLTLNRLWENIAGATLHGRVLMRFDGSWIDIYSRRCQVQYLRRKVGIVFQTPNPLPISIFKNVAFPLKLAGIKDKALIAAKVQSALEQAYLWKEVRDRLADNALCLSGGQQQRLCIARALITAPEVLLFDEPTASLDQRAAGVIEDLMVELKQSCTLVMVSHYQDQISRVADQVFTLSHR